MSDYFCRRLLSCLWLSGTFSEGLSRAPGFKWVSFSSVVFKLLYLSDHFQCGCCCVLASTFPSYLSFQQILWLWAGCPTIWVRTMRRCMFQWRKPNPNRLKWWRSEFICITLTLFYLTGVISLDSDKWTNYCSHAVDTSDFYFPLCKIHFLSIKYHLCVYTALLYSGARTVIVIFTVVLCGLKVKLSKFKTCKTQAWLSSFF